MRISIMVALAACSEPSAYAPPSTCVGCHVREAAQWRGSHHDLAMQTASAASVRGDFATTFEDARFSRDGDMYVIDDARGHHRVRYTFGVEPLQQYLVDGVGGRLDAYPIAWDTLRHVWFRVTASDVPHRQQAWNTMCAECHSTGVEKRYDASTDTFTTRFVEEDVGCQACHGPGRAHVHDPSRPLATTTIDTCAPCHARRSKIADRGETFFDRYRPLLLHDGLYEADGQIRDEVFEYGSFAQSLMHERGVTCIDCHDTHTSAVLPGNATCTRCHNPAGHVRFPTLATRASDVDSPGHHHHAPGMACIACHMPTRTYMGNDTRHDHGFRVPRPDLGTTDPCTQACHAGRDAAWSSAIVAQWFPGPKPPNALARARRGDATRDELAALALDRAQPAIVRATVFELMPPDACAAIAPRAIADPSPLVRSTAVACAEPHVARAGLRDSVRLVRIEAARVLAGLRIDEPDRAAYAVARGELEDAYRLDLDRPEGWFNLATLAESESRTTDAIAAYRRALALDPDYAPARDNLRRLER